MASMLVAQRSGSPLGQRAVAADGATGSAVTDAIPSPPWSARATATPASRASATDGSSTTIDTTDLIHVHAVTRPSAKMTAAVSSMTAWPWGGPSGLRSEGRSASVLGGVPVDGIRPPQKTRASKSNSKTNSCAVRTSCTGSRRPRGAARAADSAARPSLPLPLPLRPAKTTPVGWREEDQPEGPPTPGEVTGPRRLDTGDPSRRLPSG